MLHFPIKPLEFFHIHISIINSLCIHLIITSMLISTTLILSELLPAITTMIPLGSSCFFSSCFFSSFPFLLLSSRWTIVSQMSFLPTLKAWSVSLWLRTKQRRISTSINLICPLEETTLLILGFPTAIEGTTLIRSCLTHLPLHSWLPTETLDVQPRRNRL